MNASTVVITAESRELICELVDNYCPLNISEQPRIVITAYCAVFLPWGFLALLDMINQRWKSIQTLFIQGILQIIIAIPTIGYTIYYIELQRADRDYKEMCAAIVAVCLSAFHFLRTLWGLWQAFRYWNWVKRCLVHLNRHNYYVKDVSDPYQSHRAKLWSRMGLIKRSLAMKVNNSVIDNEFFDCDVPFKFNWSRLLTPSEWFRSRLPWYAPRHHIASSIRYMIPFLAQFGIDWLKDCGRVKSIVEGDMDISDNTFFMTYAFKCAKMLTTRWFPPKNATWLKKNWSETWSHILMFQKVDIFYGCFRRKTLPFGSGVLSPLRLDSYVPRSSYTMHESKIKRFIDNLPEELFEDPFSGENEDQIKYIRSISAFHLQSFVLFLDSELVPLPDGDASSEKVHPDLMVSRTNSVAALNRTSMNPEGRQERKEEEISFHWWSHDRIYCEKLSVRKSEDLRRSDFWEKYQVEFTIHLENIFALLAGEISYHPSRKPASDMDRDAYYKELCDGRRTICKVMAGEKVMPRCAAQRQYWRLWNLPACIPPALGDRDLAEDGKRGGIKFIGYNMEMVRECLAKWTSTSHLSADSDISRWSPKIAADRTLIIVHTSNRRSDYSLQAHLFDKAREEDLRSDHGLSTVVERVIWEFQNHFMTLMASNKRFKGPSDVRLMLMCMLSFPTLQPEKPSGCRRMYLVPHRWAPLKVCIQSLWSEDDLLISIRRNCSSAEDENNSSITFEWAKWIHDFEACMRVLRYEYGPNDLLPVAISSTSGNGRDEENSEEHDVGALGDNDRLVDDARETNTTRTRRGTARDLGTNDESDTNVDAIGTDGAEPDADEVSVPHRSGDEEDRAVVSAGCSCGCEYRLNTKAEPMLITDKNGVRKYYWEWEGWRAQPAFERGRFPIVHSLPARAAAQPSVEPQAQAVENDGERRDARV